MRKFNRFIVVLIIFATIGVMVPDAAYAGGNVAWGVANVSGSGVRVRSAPNLSGSILAHANRGDAVVILARTNSEWYRVNYNGNVGYMSAPLLERARTRANFNAQGRITGASVRLRERPNTTSAVVSNATRGTVMSILGINEGWYKVSHNGNIAYVRSDLMEKVELSTQSASAEQRGRVTGSSINLRARPTTASGILATARRGTVMIVLGNNSGWFRVSFSGVTAYVRQDLMEIVPSSTPLNTVTTPAANLTVGEQAATLARSLVGSQYVWGGASRSGFDCSGLVTYVLRQFGVRVTRTASGMFRDNGTPVGQSELVPGDLVFFARDGVNVHHVGIYVGNGQFVHASDPTRGVIVTRLSSRTLHGARRVL